MKFAGVVLMFVALAASLSAACGGGPQSNIYTFNDFEVGAGFTYRHDDFKFKLNNECFGVKTERHFNNININQFSAYAKGVTFNHFYFRGYGDYGWIDNGSTKEEVTVNNILNFIHEGCVSEVCTFDVSLAVGYQLDFCTTNFRVAPLFGYSWHVQYYRSHNNKVVFDIDGFIPPCGELKFKEDYKPNWYGPWVGIDAEYDCYCNWTILVGLEYHWAEYQAEFRRNHVVVDGVDFSKIDRNDYGCGEGFIGNVGLRNDFCPNWSLLVMCSFQTWNLHHGLADEEFAYNEERFISKIEYVRLDTIQATVAISYHF